MMLVELLRDNQTIEQALGLLLEHCHDVDGALVSTIDGLPIQQCCRRTLNGERVSAMASTFISLGDTITGELDTGECRNIILENERGLVTLMHINDELILVCSCRNPGSLGMLLSASRTCAETIRENVAGLR